MSDIATKERGNITLKERNQIKPSEVNLDYLVHDLKKVSEVKAHAYDLSIFTLNLSKFPFQINKDQLEIIFRKDNILSINKIYELKLLDLSMVGFVPDPNVADTYDYINQFIKSIDKTIDDDIKKELEFSDEWERQYKFNLDKYEEAQCNNKKGYIELKFLKFRINQFLKEINRVTSLSKNNRTDSEWNATLERAHLRLRKFIEDDLFQSTTANNIETEKKESILSVLNLKLAPNVSSISNNSNEYWLELLHEYKYILKYYQYFLSIFLMQLKLDKNKRAYEIFSTDSLKYKTLCLNSIPEDEYIEANEYNLSHYYDLFRYSLINKINEIIDRDITRRKIVDGFFQFTPNLLGIGTFVVILYLYFLYKFTLLKEMWERYNILITFIVMSFFALIALVNLLRNSKQFKRPKRAKFQKVSLFTYVGFSLITLLLGVYFINRYDGYDSTYYYVNLSESTIQIDGLVSNEENRYTIPQSIDQLQVSIVSKKHI